MDYLVSSSYLGCERYDPSHRMGLIRKPTSKGVLSVPSITDLKPLSQYRHRDYRHCKKGYAVSEQQSWDLNCGTWTGEFTLLTTTFTVSFPALGPLTRKREGAEPHRRPEGGVGQEGHRGAQFGRRLAGGPGLGGKLGFGAHKPRNGLIPINTHRGVQSSVSVRGMRPTEVVAMGDQSRSSPTGSPRPFLEREAAS